MVVVPVELEKAHTEKGSNKSGRKKDHGFIRGLRGRLRKGWKDGAPRWEFKCKLHGTETLNGWECTKEEI